MIAIIHSLKCTVSFSFAVPLLSLAIIHWHSLSLFVTRCHSLSLVITTLCHSFYHSLSLVVIRCHSLSLDVSLVCLFRNDRQGIVLIDKNDYYNSMELLSMTLVNLLYYKKTQHYVICQLCKLILILYIKEMK